ncbi:MAG: glycine cleavage system aminomethyltransferase GcvT [Tepidisphaerales bacterium]
MSDTPPTGTGPARPLLRTPFYDFHVEAGAKFVEFAGWEMPILYKSIAEEHHQCRNSGAIFDVSHMGRLQISGRDALGLLDKALTRKLSDMKVGQSRYSLICNERGGVIDDVIVSRDVKQWLMVCNASNRDAVHRHFIAVRRQFDFDCDLVDQTMSTAMVAIQGPKVIDRVAGVLPVDVKNLKRYHFESANLLLFKVYVFRSGYTGEDGIEVILPAKAASMAIKLIAGSLNKENATIAPAGLGARDTLRMEAGMPLYGHELTAEIDPLSAGLGWAVDLSKDFIGAEALRKVAEAGPARRLVGLELAERRIARQHTPVVSGERVVGSVTSGTLSPTLGKSIAMAYVESAFAEAGTDLSVDLRGSMIPAKVVKLPFYKRTGAAAAAAPSSTPTTPTP